MCANFKWPDGNLKFNKDVNPVILSRLQSGHALDYNLGKRIQVANLYYRLQLGKKNTSCKFIL